MTLVIWLWNAFGQEVIFIRNGSLTYRREVFGRGLEKVYALHEVYNLRASGYFGGEDGTGEAFVQYGLRGGTVAFDTRYGDVQRFGIRLEEREAVALARALKPYIPRDREKF